MQENGDMTGLMVLQEELKTAPFGEIWKEYCAAQNVPAEGEWLAQVQQYGTDVLRNRN